MRNAISEQGHRRGAGHEVYSMELDNAPGQRIRAFRKAAWAIEHLEQDVGLTCRQMGRKGLESIENVGPRLAETIEVLIRALTQREALKNTHWLA